MHNKRNYQQNERTTYWKGRISENHIVDKGLISKLYKEFIQLNSNNTQIDQLKYRQKDMKRYYSKEDTQMATSTWKDSKYNQSSGECKSKSTHTCQYGY